jgi:hypothetical protein
LNRFAQNSSHSGGKSETISEWISAVRKLVLSRSVGRSIHRREITVVVLWSLDGEDNLQDFLDSVAKDYAAGGPFPGRGVHPE